MKKDVVVGLGEIGYPILKLLSKEQTTVGYDIDKGLMNNSKFKTLLNTQTSFLHVAIPVTSKFDSNVLKLYKKFKPECIVIHSTVSPGTTERIQKKLSVPLIYSATRGVHKRMLKDVKPKKQWATKTFSRKMKNCGIRTRQMSKPETLELGKILCDTSYLGWLINYAQLTNMIAIQYNVDYDEMWTFSDEINKFLGNRPKMYPGFIGGHCVIPNLDLIHKQTLDLIKKINTQYSKKVKNSKTIHKKYT